ncbi:MAG: hypothetical protein NTZ05_21125 [Chloroflexi bacterium]|nr:hypothetical protein [Chloroflexota bacterium]
MIQITGPQLQRLLRLDGWTEAGRRTHGTYFSKRFPGESMPRSTVIMNKDDPLRDKTLGDVLSAKQTGLGRRGLQELIDRYSIH